MTSSNADSRRQFSLVQLKFLPYLYQWDGTTLYKGGTKVPHLWWQFILIAGQVLRCLRKGNCEHDSTEERSFASTAYGNIAQCWDGVHLRPFVLLLSLPGMPHLWIFTWQTPQYLPSLILGEAFLGHSLWTQLLSHPNPLNHSLSPWSCFFNSWQLLNEII